MISLYRVALINSWIPFKSPVVADTEENQKYPNAAWYFIAKILEALPNDKFCQSSHKLIVEANGFKAIKINYN